MKKLIYIASFILVFACDSEKADDCFQTSGAIIQKEFIVNPFDKIVVNRNIELIIKGGLDQSVIVETGRNLLNDIEIYVLDGTITLTDHNSCNYFREYGVTKVFITSPNITEIRSSTQYDISSDGVLNYPNLYLLSENFSNPESFANGNFILEIDNNSFSVFFNKISNCFVSGKTNNLDINFTSGTPRFEGRYLEAQNITFWNRSSNDMIVNPIQSIKGKISGTGDVISVYRPAVVEVVELYKGKLIFK